MLMPPKIRFAATLISVAALSLVVLPLEGTARAPRVKAPKSGARYSGRTGQKQRLMLQIGGRSVDIFAFRFSCGGALANTSLNDIRLRKRRTGYRFRITAYGIVTYVDGRPDQNGKFGIRGRFSRDARRVRGRLRARLPGCATGAVRWSARRRRAGANG